MVFFLFQKEHQVDCFFLLLKKNRKKNNDKHPQLKIEETDPSPSLSGCLVETKTSIQRV